MEKHYLRPSSYPILKKIRNLINCYHFLRGYVEGRVIMNLKHRSKNKKIAFCIKSQMHRHTFEETKSERVWLQLWCFLLLFLWWWWRWCWWRWRWRWHTEKAEERRSFMLWLRRRAHHSQREEGGKATPALSMGCMYVCTYVDLDSLLLLSSIYPPHHPSIPTKI